MARAFRLVKRRHAARAFDGEGARRFGGRWNPPGVAVVYASDSIALAALELLVHLDDVAHVSGFVLCAIELPDALIEPLAARRLPAAWRSAPPPDALQAIGSAWAQARRSVVLRVPSAVVPREHNYLLNPLHPDFRKLTPATPEAFELDPRLGRRR